MNFLFALLCAIIGGYLLAEGRRTNYIGKAAVIYGPSLLLPAIQLKDSTLLMAVACGLSFALVSVVFSLIALRLPLLVCALMTISQSILWTLFALCAHYLLPLPLVISLVAIACAGTALSWLEWSLLPLWGTAQNFACTAPINRSLISLFGAAFGTWSSLLISGWWAKLYASAIDAQHTWEIIVIGAVAFAFFGAMNYFLKAKSPQKLRVAVFGWADGQLGSLVSLNLKLTETVREASEQGAKILVTPEAAIQVEDIETFRLSLQTLAAKNKIALAIGYFDSKRRENCIDMVDANGEFKARYVKTHLVPVFETYQKGSGEIAMMEVDGVKIGGLICQDDNFPDIACKYAKAGAQLLVVPTNDWKNVKDLHFASHRWRAIEFRFALARAASDGISSLIGSDGEVLQSSDHFKFARHLIVGDIPVGTGKPTLYAKIGDIFPIACGIFALGCLIFAR